MKRFLLIVLLMVVGNAWGQDPVYYMDLTDIDFRSWTDDRTCSTKVEISVIYEDNRGEELIYSSTEEQLDGKMELDIPLRAKVKSIKYYLKVVDAEKDWLWTTCCIDCYTSTAKGTAFHYNPIICDSKKVTTLYEKSEERSPQAKGWLTFNYRIRPNHTLKTESINGVDNKLLPSDDKVKLYAKKGFDESLYHYQYSIAHPRKWKDIDPSLYDKDVLSVSAKDLFGADYEKYLGKTIFFRVVSCYENKKYLSASYSYSTSLTISPSAPRILKISELIQPKCSDGRGSVTFEFDRKLLPEETEVSFVYDGIFLKGEKNKKLVEQLRKGTTVTIDDLEPGDHSIRVTSVYKGQSIFSDGKQYKEFEIEKKEPVEFEINPNKDVKDVYCYGGNDGSIKVTASGGTGNYQYSKNNEDWVNFTDDKSTLISGLTEGKYTIKVRDTNECIAKEQGQEKVENIQISQPNSALEIVYDEKNDLKAPTSFGAKDGYISVEIRGGTSDGGFYSYEWRKGSPDGDILTDVDVSRYGIFGMRLNKVEGGKYYLTVKDANYSKATSKENCGIISKEFIVVEPGQLIPDIELKQGISCNPNNQFTDKDDLNRNNVPDEAENGILEVKVKGGVPPYTYQWQREESGGFKNIIGANDVLLENLVAGTYKVIVRDKNNIVNEEIYKLENPSELKLQFSGVNLLCPGINTGEASVSATGGSGSYTYLWSNGATTSKITGLSAGEYKVTVRDGNNCPISGKIEITQPEESLHLTDEYISIPTGNDFSDGYITLVVRGGVSKVDSSYDFEWHKGSYTGGVLTDVETEVTSIGYRIRLENLSAGKYYLVVKDANYDKDPSKSDCGRVLREFIVAEPVQLIPIIKLKQGIFCNSDNLYSKKEDIDGNNIPDETESGILEVKVSGGVAPYTYRWQRENSGVFEDIVGADSALLENLTSGTYKVIVRDKNNIVSSNTYKLESPSELKLQLSGVNLLCPDINTGEASVSVTGGSGSYTYFWSNGATTSKITGLASGEYEVTVRDEKGCPVSGKIKVTQPKKKLQIANEYISYPKGNGFSNGSITLVIDGGTPNTDKSYNFEWRKDSYTGDRLTDIETKVIGEGYQIKLNNLSEGKYYFIVKDKNYNSSQPTDCLILRKEFEIVEPDPLELTIIAEKHISCNIQNENNQKIDADDNRIPDEAEDGVLKAIVKGGVKPYTYQWGRGVNGNFKIIKEGDYSTLDKLTEGNYQLRIIDSNGNSIEATKELLFPPKLEVMLKGKDLLCYNVNTGEVTSKVIGGTGSYKYSWNGGAYTSASISNLSAGKYAVIVVDDNGCSVSSEVILEQPSATLEMPQEAIKIKEPTGYGLSNGFIEVKITGGTSETDGAYRYEWHKDSLDGTLITTAETNIIDKAFTIKLNNISTGKYYLTVKDKNYKDSTSMDCLILTKDFIINQPDPLLTEIKVGKMVSCNIANKYDYKEDLDNNNIPDKSEDGVLMVTVKGGVGDYKYQWQKKVNTTFENIADETFSTLKKVTAGVYKVIVGDTNNNTASSEYEMKYPEELIVRFTTDELKCYGDTEGKISANVSGGTGEYHFQWNTQDTTADIENLSAGNYFILVTDDNGCNTNGRIAIDQPDLLEISDILVQNPLSPGASNGGIQIDILGGQKPYDISWSNGMKDKSITHLSQGKYTVTITDRNNCSVSKEYILTDPDKLNIDLGDDVITLCKGDTKTYDVKINDPKATYQWTDDKGNVISSLSEITLSEAGTYSVKVTNSYGNFTSDKVTVKISDKILRPEFLITTHAYLEASVKLVNSSKVTPESVEWVIPDNPDIQVLNKSDEYLELMFSKTGAYTIGLKGMQGSCEKTFYKDIIVEENLEGVELNPTAISNIKEFVIVPNPNKGRYRVLVKLHKTQDIQLRIFNISTQEPYAPVTRIGSEEFDIPFNLNLSAGVYLIILETGGESQVKKMIVQ